jgi:S1-C subfamily serine protease
MFQEACRTVRESVYGIKAATPIGINQMNVSTGTGFMIAPGLLATCAHVIHFECNPSKEVQQKFEVIRAPDIGQQTEPDLFVAEDIAKDIALLKIANPRSTQSIFLEPSLLNVGTSCGSLGFPLSFVDPQGRYLLDLRFQGAFISSFNNLGEFYETDSLMYNGSSGCPLFTTDARVFGMQSRVITSEPSSVLQPVPQSRQQRREQMRQMQKLQAKNPQPQRQTDRFAISLCVPSTQIITFARTNGVNI